MASTGLDIWATDVKRRGKYKFGKQQIQFYKPTKGYPSESQAAAKPKKQLQLEHVYGYSGGNRQCMIAKDGKIAYFLAAAGIVYDVETNSQQFFLEHNDDVTCICADPREGSTLVATGQKDPKDVPGKGKDLPKIYIWDMMSMEKMVLIDRVCVQFVRGLRWSPATGYLYVLCGDDGQSLKVYNTSSLTPGGKASKAVQKVMMDSPTTRQKIHGYVLNPKPKGCLDEIVFFCTGKVLVGKVTEGKGGKLALGKLQAITIKTKEKAYLDAVFFPSGRFVVAGATGNMYFCEGPKLDREVKGAHKKAVKAFALNPSGNTLYSASMDGTLKSWDSRGKSKWSSDEIEVKDSDFTMTPQTLQFDEPTNSLYVGSKSNQIMRYEMKTNEPTVVIDGHDGQVWGLACHPKKNFFITGGWDRAVKVWNPDTWKCVRTKEFPKAKKKGKKEKGGDDKKEKEKEMEPERYRLTQCATSPNGNWIAVGTSDSTIVILGYAKLNVATKFRIPKANAKNELEGIEYLRFSPNGKMLAAAHGDGNMYIFTMSVKKEGEKKKVELKKWKACKHRAAPSHLQWGADNMVVKTLTRDYEVVHWVLDSKKKVAKMFAKIPDPDKYEFAGDPLIAGWDVQGLYQDGWDGTDMNDASKTSDGKLIATGDDFGTVRLHRFPAIDKEACYAYPGHAEHVVGVEFLANDKMLLTCGGADMAIFQWRVV